MDRLLSLDSYSELHRQHSGGRRPQTTRARPGAPLVRYGTSSIDRLAPIADLSEGGLFIQTYEFYPVGTRIQMVIEFRGRSVRHRGKVRWATRAPDHLYDSVVQGMGVQFVHGR